MTCGVAASSPFLRDKNWLLPATWRNPRLDLEESHIPRFLAPAVFWFGAWISMGPFLSAGHGVHIQLVAAVEDHAEARQGLAASC